MQIAASVVLGIVQGLTEFLPISSSAHLILVPWVLGLEPEGLAFDVSLHVGTSVAVLTYFWKDWVILAKEVLRGLADWKPLGNPERRLGWFIIVGTLPAGAAGLALDDYIEEYLRSPVVLVIALIIFGLLLYLAERWGRQNRNINQFTWSDSLWIGFSQAVALIPGVSRSGITISTALLRHVDRSSAARFSFLLSTPIIIGAGLLECWRAWHDSYAISGGAVSATAATDYWILAVGTATSAVTGFFCIRYFLRYLRANSLLPFVVYRLLLAAIILVMLGVRH